MCIRDSDQGARVVADEVPTDLQLVAAVDRDGHKVAAFVDEGEPVDAGRELLADRRGGGRDRQ